MFCEGSFKELWLKSTALVSQRDYSSKTRICITLAV
ncbi:unnamed protein product [Tenebrio molitor]|nr:unnamed protein product [Tenebrio molitor]